MAGFDLPLLPTATALGVGLLLGLVAERRKLDNAGMTAGLRTQEVIGEHPALVARHTREGLQAKLYAQIEQAKFDAAQEKRLADQRLRRAESDVIDAAQRLRILGVSENIRELLEHADKADQIAVDEDVTIYRINSPFDGTVKAVHASEGDQVAGGALLVDLEA